MIPLEVVTRGVAAGSFVKRNPGLQRGALLVPRVIEFFFKDDAAHDPLITPDQIVAQNIAAPQEVGVMTELARLTFDILSHAWRKRDVLLVDLKIEFGRLAGGENQGQLVIADVIDNDSWRIWPQGREELMLDKQMYRNLEKVDDAALDRVKRAYERVADMVGTFPVMRPGMAAVIADSPAQVERAERSRQGARAARLADGSARCKPDRDARIRAAVNAAARGELRALDPRRRRRERPAPRDARCNLVGAGTRRDGRAASAGDAMRQAVGS